LIDDSDLDERHKAGRWLCMIAALAILAGLVALAIAGTAAGLLAGLAHFLTR
jgi:hypothetical protein